MLGFLLNARIGRLHFFFSSILLAVVMTIVIFGLVMSAYHSAQVPLSLAEIKWPLIVVGAFFLLASLTLQSMRIRDIGWDPVCVIPAWIALAVVDKVVATKFPAWSIGPEQHGTIVGALVNLGLMLALMFWPSGEYTASPPAFGAPPRRRDAAGLTASRVARVANGEFGRRP